MLFIHIGHMARSPLAAVLALSSILQSKPQFQRASKKQPPMVTAISKIADAVGCKMVLQKLLHKHMASNASMTVSELQNAFAAVELTGLTLWLVHKK